MCRTRHAAHTRPRHCADLPQGEVEPRKIACVCDGPGWPCLAFGEAVGVQRRGKSRIIAAHHACNGTGQQCFAQGTVGPNKVMRGEQDMAIGDGGLRRARHALQALETLGGRQHLAAVQHDFGKRRADEHPVLWRHKERGGVAHCARLEPNGRVIRHRVTAAPTGPDDGLRPGIKGQDMVSGPKILNPYGPHRRVVIVLVPPFEVDAGGPNDLRRIANFVGSFEDDDAAPPACWIVIGPDDNGVLDRSAAALAAPGGVVGIAQLECAWIWIAFQGGDHKVFGSLRRVVKAGRVWRDVDVAPRRRREFNILPLKNKCHVRTPAAAMPRGS